MDVVDIARWQFGIIRREVLDATPGRSVVWISHDAIGLDRMDRVIHLGDR